MKGKAPPPARLLRALADETRLRILRLIGKQEVCVCYFVEALSESQPKVSRHLAYLRREGLVKTRREGKWMHYQLAELNDRRASKLLAEALDWMGEQPIAARDAARFKAVCCQPEKLVTLQGAPQPGPAKRSSRHN